jgi:hypothetical protein
MQGWWLSKLIYKKGDENCPCFFPIALTERHYFIDRFFDKPHLDMDSQTDTPAKSKVMRIVFHSQNIPGH